MATFFAGKKKKKVNMYKEIGALGFPQGD